MTSNITLSLMPMVLRLRQSSQMKIFIALSGILSVSILLHSCFHHVRKSGKERTYYSNGKIESEISYKNGKKHGPFKVWNSNGELNSEAYFENDSLVGRATHYYDNGKKNYESNRNNNYKLHGLYRVWYRNGVLSDSGYNKNGQREGEWYKFDERGQANSIKNFREGKLVGPSIYFKSGGDTLRIEFYEAGTLVKTKVFE
jgi:uncharacterized protein